MKKKSRYKPHDIEGMNIHVLFFFATVFGLCYEIFHFPTMPFWTALAASCYMVLFPVYIAIVDYRTMLKRREFVEQFFHENYWSAKE